MKKKEVARLEEIIEVMARSLHEDWRIARRTKDAKKFKPCWKPARDIDFEKQWLKRLGSGEKSGNIRVQDGKLEIDIANTPYDKLSNFWKKENKASAEIAMREVMKAKQEGRKINKDFIKQASSVVHERWLERNRDRVPPEQNKHYLELSEKEKEKDRLCVRKAIEMCFPKEK